jgi:serine/threonine protein kinase
VDISHACMSPGGPLDRLRCRTAGAMDIPEDVRTIPAADVAPVEGDDGLLGRGALGEVRRGTWRAAQGVEATPVALKRLFMLRDDRAALADMGGALAPEERAAVAAAFLRECTVLSRANHPNLLPFYGIVLDESAQPLFMATALAPSGSLRDLCQQERYEHLRDGAGSMALSHALAVDVLHDIFLALEYLHTRAQPVIHRDVKPANVLIELVNYSDRSNHCPWCSKCNGGGGIQSCGYDGPAASLAHLLASAKLQPRVPRIKSNLLTFNQSVYCPSGVSHNMAENASIYVPSGCQPNSGAANSSRDGCHLHVFLVGCDGEGFFSPLVTHDHAQ